MSERMNLQVEEYYIYVDNCSFNGLETVWISV